MPHSFFYMPYTDLEKRRAYRRAYKEANVEKVRAQRRESRRRVMATPEGKARADERWKRFCERNPEKIEARNAKPRVEITPEGKARACAREKRYRERHPEKIRARRSAANRTPENLASTRNSNLKRLYGITHAAYEQMLEAQNESCAICGSLDPGPTKIHFAVDHDHTTGKVRQLLCLRCNLGLSMFKDNPELFENARLYLIKHGAISG